MRGRTPVVSMKEERPSVVPSMEGIESCLFLEGGGGGGGGFLIIIVLVGLERRGCGCCYLGVDGGYGRSSGN